MQAPIQARTEVVEAEAEVEVLRAEYSELRAEIARLRQEKSNAVVLPSGAMAVLRHLFGQCSGRWPEYQAPGGFTRWLVDAAFSFFVLNGRVLGVSLGSYAAGALGATPMLGTLLRRAVLEFVQGTTRS